MIVFSKRTLLAVRTLYAVATIAALALTACGGSGSSTGQSAGATGPAGVNAVVAPAMKPAYHLLPVLLDAPPRVDAARLMDLAHTPPLTLRIPAALAAMDTRGLRIRDVLQGRLRAQSASALSEDTPISVFTPPQIRAAYGFPPQPAASPMPKVTLPAAQAAQLGAGQTIYIVDASDDPNIYSELLQFDSYFGIQDCNFDIVRPGTPLPLPAASITDICTLSVVHATPGGSIASAAPATDPDWQIEIVLDVEWAHAMAPLARIVLVEAVDAEATSLLGAISLANKMGPGIVSMSFGAPEFGVFGDSALAAPGMTYVAAAGDSGSGVEWPSVNPAVLAVGGTSTSYSGDGIRSETAWSSSGGGVSSYYAAPAYQSSNVPGMGMPAHRSVPDVAFNADPNSGQYILVMPVDLPGQLIYGGVGGTSVSAPHWAAVLAIANAMRAQSGQGALGFPNTALYALSSTPGTYAKAFADIDTGANGTCGTCSAKTGYDLVTGLGSPNVSALLNLLSPSSIPIALNVNLIADPDFEWQPSWDIGYELIDGNAIRSWTGNGAIGRWFEPYSPQGADGGISWIELDANSNFRDVVSQTVHGLAAGKVYTLSYWVAAHPGTPAATNAYAVTWNGVTIDSGAPEGGGLTTPNWQQRTVQVTAQGLRDTLSFVDTGMDDGLGTLLDTVSLQDLSGALQ